MEPVVTSRAVGGGRDGLRGRDTGPTNNAAALGKRLSAGMSSNKPFRAMTSLTSARTSTSNNNNNDYLGRKFRSTSLSLNLGLTDTGVGERNSDGSGRKGRFSIHVLSFKGISPATTTISSPSSQYLASSLHLLTSQHGHQQYCSPSTFTSNPPSTSTSSTSPFHNIASASHCSPAYTKPSNNRAQYHDRHLEGFRPQAAHSAHTIEASSTLKPVIPSPSLSEYSTVAVSADSTLSSSSDSYSSALKSSSSTPTFSRPISTTNPQTSPRIQSSPSRSSVRASYRKQSLKPNSKRIFNSAGLRQTPSLPVLFVVPPPGEDRGDGEARRPAMQRVSSFLPTWDKRTSSGSTSRPGLFGWSSNRSSTGNTSMPSPSALAKINTAAANANARISLGKSQMQREAFWPAALDIECEKAARILKSFSTDGYLAPLDEDDDQVQATDPQTPVQITKKIPRRIIQNAAGIAIFTCMRSGLWMTGSGGSGILIARKSDGTWSPPSGIMLHTPTLSFIIGVDIYDCVLIINNLAALESITKPRVTLGEDVGLTGGPLVSLDSDEAHIRWKDLGNTVLTYMKARGQNQTVNLNGCILAERANENERFYSGFVTQMDILAGNVSRNVEETKPLFEVIKMAEGRSDYDTAVVDRIAFELAPGDAMIATPQSSTPASPHTAFGIPAADDPDPFGVLALEMAGLEIREAGTRLRPNSNQFDFNPVPTSPAFSKFSRQSLENFPKSNRASFMSSRTVKSQMTDAGTQTDVGNTPETTPSPSRSEGSYGRTSPTQIPEVTEEEEIDYTKVDMTPLRHLSTPPTPVKVTSQGTTMVQEDTPRVEEPSLNDDIDKASSTYENEIDEDDIDGKANDKDDLDEDDRDADDEDELDDSESDSEDDEEDDEEPVVFEVAAVQPARTQAVASRVIHAKGNMVTIPKRVPPPLPMRSPARTSRSSKTEIGDVSHLRSPLRQEFPESDINADDGQKPKTESPAYLKPFELKLVPVVPERRDSVKSKAENESLPANETKASDAESTEEAKIEEIDIETATTPKTTESKGLEPSLSIPQLSHSDSSDSLTEKRTSSIYTGNTENRWSMDGSSLTTPTSDRPYSVIDDAVDDETPRKPIKETERIELNEKYEELEKMGSKETTPNTITVA